MALDVVATRVGMISSLDGIEGRCWGIVGWILP